jgi:hypothetical protein
MLLSGRSNPSSQRGNVKWHKLLRRKCCNSRGQRKFGGQSKTGARQRGCLWGGRVDPSATVETHPQPSFRLPGAPRFKSRSCRRIRPPRQPRGIPSPDSCLDRTGPGKSACRVLGALLLIVAMVRQMHMASGVGQEALSLGSLCHVQYICTVCP